MSYINHVAANCQELENGGFVFQVLVLVIIGTVYCLRAQMICTNVPDAGHVFFSTLGVLVKKSRPYELTAM